MYTLYILHMHYIVVISVTTYPYYIVHKVRVRVRVYTQAALNQKRRTTF